MHLFLPHVRVQAWGLPPDESCSRRRGVPHRQSKGKGDDQVGSPKGRGKEGRLASFAQPRVQSGEAHQQQPPTTRRNKQKCVWARVVTALCVCRRAVWAWRRRGASLGPWWVCRLHPTLVQPMALLLRCPPLPPRLSTPHTKLCVWLSAKIVPWRAWAVKRTRYLSPLLVGFPIHPAPRQSCAACPPCTLHAAHTNTRPRR